MKAMYKLHYGICTKPRHQNKEIALTHFKEFILGVLGCGICTNLVFGICTRHLQVWNLHYMTFEGFSEEGICTKAILWNFKKMHQAILTADFALKILDGICTTEFTLNTKNMPQHTLH